ncbi:MAG: LicD family protein [Lachnospiraceae bacterium]|nr:LicD family protein [Lachnospiraceae bacterium]
MIENSLKNIQAEEIRMLEIFKAICEKYQLRYFAIGGTCIGAIRHQGFIPWDDDIDVGMPYEDYRRFREVAPRELPAPYALLDPAKERYCDFDFLKIHNTETTFIEAKNRPFKSRYSGVFIDIMPICGTAPGMGLKTMKRTNLLLKKNRSLRFSFNRYKKLQARLLYLATLPVRLLKPWHYYTDKIEDIMGAVPFEAGENVLLAWREVPLFKAPQKRIDRLVMPTAYFDGYQEMPFEDTTIRVPRDYDSYLTRDFGDYMTLPPEDQRVTVHPGALIDLNRSYVSYREENL